MHYLVDEWREAWKWLQVQLGAIIAIAPELYHQLEPMQAYLPPSVFRHVMSVLGVLVIINSLRKKPAA